MVENIIRINRAEFDRLALLTEKKKGLLGGELQYCNSR